MGGKEADRVVDAHREHIADARFPPRHGERLGIEAPSAAYVTQHLDVGEEAHLDGLHALACARLAAPAGGVEREEIGRASCRERGWIPWAAGALKETWRHEH